MFSRNRTLCLGFMKVDGNSTIVEFYSSNGKPHSWEHMTLLRLRRCSLSVNFGHVWFNFPNRCTVRNIKWQVGYVNLKFSVWSYVEFETK